MKKERRFHSSNIDPDIRGGVGIGVASIPRHRSPRATLPHNSSSTSASALVAQSLNLWRCRDAAVV